MNGAAQFIAEYLKISIDDALKVQTILSTEGFHFGFCPLVAFKRLAKRVWNEMNKKSMQNFKRSW